MSKKFILGMFVVLGFLIASFPSHADIVDYNIATDDGEEFAEMYWQWDSNGYDMVGLSGTYWNSCLLIDPTSDGFNVTYGFSSNDGVVFSSGPLSFPLGSSTGETGYFEFDNVQYGHELYIDVHSADWAHAYTYVWNQDLLFPPGIVVPEPISSLLFVFGGTLLTGRLYMKRKKKA